MLRFASACLFSEFRPFARRLRLCLVGRRVAPINEPSAHVRVSSAAMLPSLVRPARASAPGIVWVIGMLSLKVTYGPTFTFSDMMSGVFSPSVTITPPRHSMDTPPPINFEDNESIAFAARTKMESKQADAHATSKPSSDYSGLIILAPLLLLNSILRVAGGKPKQTKPTEFVRRGQHVVGRREEAQHAAGRREELCAVRAKHLDQPNVPRRSAEVVTRAMR